MKDLSALKQHFARVSVASLTHQKTQVRKSHAPCEAIENKNELAAVKKPDRQK